MKKQYWFVGLFGIWCLLSTLWYFLSVKGISTDPRFFNPHVTFVAILEILVMLLGACLLGYAVAWWLREETIQTKEEKLDKLHAEKRILVESHDELKNQVELWKDKHQHDVESVQIRLNDLMDEKSKLQREVEEARASLIVAKAETTELESRVKLLDSETSTSGYRIRQLEFQIKESEEKIARLRSELENALSHKEIIPSVSGRQFGHQLYPTEKDDLTKIKGIGPFIEKRLNMIGIYTFQQLAELSPELVDRVGAAIEFFPHRIVRDDWVGQASKLLAAKSY